MATITEERLALLEAKVTHLQKLIKRKRRIVKHKTESEALTDITARLNTVYSGQKSGLAPVLAAIQSLSVVRDDW